MHPSRPTHVKSRTLTSLRQIPIFVSRGSPLDNPEYIKGLLHLESTVDVPLSNLLFGLPSTYGSLVNVIYQIHPAIPLATACILYVRQNSGSVLALIKSTWTSKYCCQTRSCLMYALLQRFFRVSNEQCVSDDFRTTQSLM